MNLQKCKLNHQLYHKAYLFTFLDNILKFFFCNLNSEKENIQERKSKLLIAIFEL